MNQGVVESLKMQYGKKILLKFITALENNQPTSKTNLWEIKSENSKIWEYDVTDCTIRKGFSKAKFFVSNENLANMGDGNDTNLEGGKQMRMQQRDKEKNNVDVQIGDFFQIILKLSSRKSEMKRIFRRV